MRTVDGTANPYIALAAILGLGLVGVQKGLELTIEGVDGSAADLSAEERTRRGIVRRINTTLGKSRDAARNDPIVREVLGQDFVEKYLNVNEVRDHKVVVLLAFTS